MKKLLRTLVSSAVVATCVSFAPQAVAQDRCPDTVVIAARGSGQNGGWEWQPTRYGNSAWVSNGREGITLRNFFLHAEAVSQREGAGSLFENTQVIGVDENAYPARFPETDYTQPTNIMEAMGVLTGTFAPRAESFLESISIGRVGAAATVANYEATTGCRPKYIVAGFSQGAVTITELETQLAKDGRLAGAFYMGSPVSVGSDPARIGSGTSGTGALSLMPSNANRLRANSKRVDYCIEDDLWCDFNPIKLAKGDVKNPMAHNEYYTGSAAHQADRDEVARRFAGLIRGA